MRGRIKTALGLALALFATVAISAAAQAASPAPGDTSMLLYAIGVVNSLMMGLLLYHMNNAAKQREIRDTQLNAALSAITHDLKQLNDAVLSQYVTEEQFKAAVDALRAEMKEETHQRREADHEALGKLHQFELKLTAHNIINKAVT